MKKMLILLLTAILLTVPLCSCGNGKEIDVSEAYAPVGTNPEEITLKNGNIFATMYTSMGLIELELYSSKAPKCVTNFATHAINGYYDGTIFHRVIEDFMIQGGDPNGSGFGGESIWGEKFNDEINLDLPNVRGVLSMANAGTRNGKGTNGSQFFIVTAKETPHLDGKHSVFGRVTKGMDVVDAISLVETNSNDQPTEKVYVYGIRITGYEKD